MATVIWRGDAQAVAQVVTVAILIADPLTTFKVTINGKTVSALGVGVSTANTAAALQAALAASTLAEFLEITWTVNASTITGTAVTKGLPFTATSSASGGAGTIGAVTVATASAGPNDWSTPGNWSAGAVPVNGDDVVLQNSTVDILYGLDQSAVTLATMTRYMSYTGKIGLPQYTTGTSSYYEYRPRYLKIGATATTLGRGDGSGGGRCQIDFGAVATTCNVEGAGPGADSGLPAITLNGSNAANVLNITQGSIGLAIDAGATAQFPVIRIGSELSPATDVTFTAGAGCTLGAITQSGGVATVASNVTTWTKTAGASVNLAGTIGTITADGGTHYWQSNGAITTALFRGDGTALDCSRDIRARTLTNATFTGGGFYVDPLKTITFTNPYATDAKSYPLCNAGIGPFNMQRS
jgi:hypothetical protein